MNLPLSKGKVLSRLEEVLSNIAGIKVTTAISDELRVCNFLNVLVQTRSDNSLEKVRVTRFDKGVESLIKI